ncbi:MAG: hypothetical protein ACYDFT_00375 [Thermoplasmata archaeon]
MRIGRWTLFWFGIISILVVVELAEITRLFTLPLQLAYFNASTFIFSLVLITILALVGAVFVGFYLSSRIYSRRGFTPFEQEMLRMRQEVGALREEVGTLTAEIRNRPEELPGAPTPGPDGSPSIGPPSRPGVPARPGQDRGPLP